MASNSMTDAECRHSLKWAQSCINEYCPPGFWEWLEKNHASYHMQMTTEFMDKINRTWGQPRLRAVLEEFFVALSAAVPMFELHGKEGRQ